MTQGLKKGIKGNLIEYVIIDVRRSREIGKSKSGL